MNRKSSQIERRIHAFDSEIHEVDVCVVGGGMAGLIAAVSAARRGARTLLMHDRPVLGGNASSEVRMWISGAYGRNMKETGVLEEIQLDNAWRNPEGNYPMWDGVLYEKAFFTPGLTTLLNCACCSGVMEDGKLQEITGWQPNRQTWHRVRAKIFIDSSGDSILAPITGARVRMGREGRSEFGEAISPKKADAKTMGNSILIQLREVGHEVAFIPPAWAWYFTRDSELPPMPSQFKGQNFWWLELGGLEDTIRNAEIIRDNLLAAAYGVWDFLRNRSKYKDTLRNWALEWIGALPGKRESRRYVGQYLLKQDDIRAGGQFSDTIAYGGWPMDDHHPAGLYYPGHKTLFHSAPSPYGIPYRCLISADVPNLMFAGRNISVTHAALSSTRVMGTTSLLGQAAGTAAALAVRLNLSPGNIYPSAIPDLQNWLMDDDIFLPGVPRSVRQLTRDAHIHAKGENANALVNGHDRPIGTIKNQWRGEPGTPIVFTWTQNQRIGGLRIICDSKLSLNKRMPCSYTSRNSRKPVPETIVRNFRIEAKGSNGRWRVVARKEDNYHRLLWIAFPEVETKAMRIIPLSTWGSADARIFSIDILRAGEARPLPKISPPRFQDLYAKIPKHHLAPPDSNLEKTSNHQGGVA